jgi:SAM-dependent methyltransferase
MDLPLPPIELRRTVGLTDPAGYENPEGAGVLGDYREGFGKIDYSRVLDFGCGVGRMARQMMLQTAPPEEYLGLDINRAAIDWCRLELARHASNFTFRHLDFYNIGLNPQGQRAPQRFECPTDHYSLAIAISVFTHTLERDVAFYLGECAKALEPGGGLIATWFMFDKKYFPVMHDFQNALYVQLEDPSNAVYFDFSFVQKLHSDAGLRIAAVVPPPLRGFQWACYARKEDGAHVAFPEDAAPFGDARPPQS